MAQATVTAPMRRKFKADGRMGGWPRAARAAGAALR